MRRQLQIHNGVIVCEWQGTSAFPVPGTPHSYDAERRRWISDDGATVFVDVTERADAVVGATYDLANDVFTPPPPLPDYGPTLTPREFMLRFTTEERLAMRAAAKTDDTIADWFDLAISTGESVRLRHPRTVLGLAFLVSKGLLTATRRTEILSGA